MKHNTQITAILVAMFLVTQLIGLAVVNVYLPTQTSVLNQTTGNYENITVKNVLPYGMEPPPVEPGVSFSSIVISFVIAIVLIIFLTRIKAALFLRLWFFIVVIIAVGITFNAVLLNFTIYSALIAFIIAIPLSFYKVFKRNLLIHNLTELMIYPGIATIFVLLLNIPFVIVLLVLISIYDMWAVWKSKIMVKMAKFQINELKFFAGFFVPYMDKKTRLMLKNKKGKKGKKVKVNLAILGGGDVVFPIIAAGIFFKTLGLIPALFVILGATAGLLYLFMKSEKKKFYPAMPFLTVGMFIGMILGYLVSLI